MVWFDVAIAVVLAGFGIYSIAATFQNGSAGGDGTCSVGKCTSAECHGLSVHVLTTRGR